MKTDRFPRLPVNIRRRAQAERQRLTGIQAWTFVIQGDNELMIPTKLSHLMAGLIPDPRLHSSGKHHAPGSAP